MHRSMVAAFCVLLAGVCGCGRSAESIVTERLDAMEEIAVAAEKKTSADAALKRFADLSDQLARKADDPGLKAIIDKHQPRQRELLNRIQTADRDLFGKVIQAAFEANFKYIRDKLGK